MLTPDARERILTEQLLSFRHFLLTAYTTREADLQKNLPCDVGVVWCGLFDAVITSIDSLNTPSEPLAGLYHRSYMVVLEVITDLMSNSGVPAAELYTLFAPVVLKLRSKLQKVTYAAPLQQFEHDMRAIGWVPAPIIVTQPLESLPNQI